MNTPLQGYSILRALIVVSSNLHRKCKVYNFAHSNDKTIETVKVRALDVTYNVTSLHAMVVAMKPALKECHDPARILRRSAAASAAVKLRRENPESLA